jgi:hypothetical protein
MIGTGAGPGGAKAVAYCAPGARAACAGCGGGGGGAPNMGGGGGGARHILATSKMMFGQLERGGDVLLNFGRPGPSEVSSAFSSRERLL